MTSTLIPEPAYPDPQPLLPDVSIAAPYPLQALGDLLGGAAAAIIESVQVPDALAGQAVLAAAAMAAQPHANVQRAGQLIPLSLFALTIAESGDRKSAADRLALHAHYEHQHTLLGAHKAEYKEYRNYRDAYQKARTAILDSAKGDPETVAIELGKLLEPIEPPSPFILAEEPTLEGLQKSLLRGHASQGLFSDEGGQFFGGYASRPENMLKSVAGLSKLWDGSPITRIRAAEGESASRSGCRLSAHLMIQPIVAQNVLGNPLLQGQGFLARFLIAWPQSLAGSRFYRDVDPMRDVRLGRYWQRMAHLLALEPPQNEQGELAPPALPMGPQSLAAWVAQHDAIEAELGKWGELFEIKPAAAKGGENLLRIAGVLAVVENAGTITLPIIERAGMLVRWHLDEAMRLTNPTKVEPHLFKAQSLLDWLLNKGWYTFDSRKLQRAGPSIARKTAKQRDQLLAVLVEHHQLLTSDGKHFTINPAATTATIVTKPAPQELQACDSVMTSCDSSSLKSNLSQPVTDLSQGYASTNLGYVAEVANVAVRPVFGGEI